MPDTFFYSVIVPTFSRTDEVIELMNSLETQQNQNFEVIIADGSIDDAVGKVVEPFENKIELIYLHEKGLGISESRNWGVEKAKGDYIIFFDSDCVIPSQYLTVLDEYLRNNPLDAFGGPDKAHDSFSNKQKAINYAMTSFYTTGGIRGRKKHIGQYQPRSFNLGIRRDVYNSIGGFSGLKVSEDIDLSLRLYKGGYHIGFIEEAYVYHKRRSTFYKFFCQVFSFGSGRIDLQIRHGDALKPVHLLPAIFTIYLICGMMIGFASQYILIIWLGSIMAYAIIIMLDSTIQTHSMVVGLMSAYAAFIMHIGYGAGMLKALVLRYLMKSRNETSKPEITREA